MAVPAALFVCSAPSGLGLPCLRCFWVFLPSCVPPLPPAFRVFWPGVPWTLTSCGPFPPSLFFSFRPVRVCLFVLFSFSGVFFFFFLSFCFFSCCAGCAVPGSCVVVCGACWCVLLWALCFGGGRCALALCCLVPLACPPLFVLVPVVLCVTVGAVLAALLFPLLPCGVARPTPRGLGAGGGGVSSVRFVLVVPPPFGGWLRCPVLWFVVRRVVWCCCVWCVLCCVRCCVACLCSCAVLRWVVLCCCCCALLSCVAAFSAGFFFALILALPWCSGLFLFLCSAFGPCLAIFGPFLGYNVELEGKKWVFVTEQWGRTWSVATFLFALAVLTRFRAVLAQKKAVFWAPNAQFWEAPPSLGPTPRAASGEVLAQNLDLPTPYPLIHTPLHNSRWLHHTALRYVRRAQLGAYMWWKGLTSV